MRRWVVAAVALAVLLGAGVGAQAYVGTKADTTDAQRVAALRAEWDQDQSQGVPAALLQPMRDFLSAHIAPPWWSTAWWGKTRQSQLDQLEIATQRAWKSALDSAQARFHAVVAAGQSFLTQAGSLAPTGMGATVGAWEDALSSAATPAAVDALTAQDQGVLDAAKAEVDKVRAAAAAALKAAGGPDGLLGQVAALDSAAAAANLDTGNMDPLAARLHDLLANAQPASDVEAQLSDAIQSFRQTLALNDSINAGMRPLLYDVDQAGVEGTPNNAAFQKTYATLGPAFAAARNQAQLLTVQTQQQQLAQQVHAELAANSCGHNVPKGKDLVISLSLQELVAYQDGCAVKATPVTTGRPQLPTPPGSYHVFLRTSPWTMVSPWPPGSPFWYPTTKVQWVLEFREGGYFLHDAYWESPADYGPGGEFNQSAASHGCIHIPTDFMQWLYDWTPVGTPVQVVA